MSRIAFSSQTTLLVNTNRLGFALYDASAPTVLLENVPTTGPYGNPIQIMFAYNAVFGHDYVIKVWESASGTATGLVRNVWTGTVSGQNVMVRDTLYLKVGVTSGLTNGLNSYDDTTWAGWNYKIERNSKTIIPDDPGVDGIPHYHRKTTGGFNLIDSSLFIDGEDFCVEFEAQVIAGPSGTPSNPVGSGQILTTDTSLDATYFNQALFIQGATNKINLKLPDLSMVNDYDFANFISEGGSHINATIQANTGDKIKHIGDRDILHLGKAESLQLFKAPTGPSGASRWNVWNDLTGTKIVGELVYNYQDGANMHHCDGAEVNRDVYGRLWAWVQTLPSALIVSEATWNTPTTINGVQYYTHRAKFSTGDGTTTFRFPLITDFMLRPVNGSGRLAASFQYQALMSHFHFNGVADDGSELFVYGGISTDLPGLASATVKSEANGRTTQGLTSTVGGSEGIPNNTAVYISIRI